MNFLGQKCLPALVRPAAVLPAEGTGTGPTVASMKKLTILHVLETPGPGGAETVVWNLATRLNGERFRSLALVGENSWLGGKLAKHGVPTFSVNWKRWYDLRLPRAMVKLIRQEKVDLIHSHLPDDNFYSCLAGGWTGCRTLVTYHGPVEITKSNGLRGLLKFGVVRSVAAKVVVVCDYVGGMLQDAGFAAHKIIRIYNGIELERLAGPRRGVLREELGLSNGTKLVGTVANIRQSKGYEFFIRAAKQVALTHPHAQFVAVGDVDGEIAEPLFKLVRELGLENCFHFLGFRENVPEVLADLDVFVLASTSEGFPLVTLEAMGAGRPVVATRCGGPQEVVEDGRTGYLVPVADVAALAASISELLASPEQAAALGARARAKIESEFSVEKMIAAYEQLYTQVGSRG